MAQLRAIRIFLMAAFWIGSAVPSIAGPSCQSVNDAVDRDAQSYNTATINSNESTCDVADFLQDFQMTLLWFTLPFKANVYATNGLLTVGNLSRSAEATQCSNSPITTLQTEFEFDEIRVSYDMTSKFYHWQTDGTYSCRIQQPTVKLTYTKGDALGCRIASFELGSSGNHECQVVADSNSWSAWLVGKAVHYALLSKQPTSDSMVSSFLQASYSLIDVNFGKSWC